MTNRERVVRAINFENPDKVPLWLLNKGQEEGDILWYDIRIQEGGHSASYHGGDKSEWGFTWNRLDDGTMGMPAEPVIKTWDDLESYKLPDLDPDRRLKNLPDFLAQSEGYFRLAVPIITGFEIYRALRGFQNTMIDLIEENENALFLLDKIFSFEKEIMTLSAENGFHGFYFGDDWGTQRDLMISPELWRRIFKPRYEDQFHHAKSLGMYTIFHSCGNITKIVPELHEIGLDVMYISQPRVVDVDAISSELKGKQCFMSLVDWQEISIPGTPEDITREGRRLLDLFNTEKGGFIGYIEDYSCMGMSAENFQASVNALSLNF
jgi:uroporphyrinogen decarboxylase